MLDTQNPRWHMLPQAQTPAGIYGKKDMEAAKQEFARMVRRADRICIIGAGINEADTHIWGPIGHASAEIQFVGSPWDERSFTNWVGKTGHARNFNASGFKAFVAAGAMKG